MGIDEPAIDPEAFRSDVEMRVGEILSARPFPEARKDRYPSRSTSDRRYCGPPPD